MTVEILLNGFGPKLKRMLTTLQGQCDYILKVMSQMSRSRMKILASRQFMIDLVLAFVHFYFVSKLLTLLIGYVRFGATLFLSNDIKCQLITSMVTLRT